MRTNLHDMATRILLAEEVPLSKVRFAKIIYFVHKSLIKDDILSSSDILYVRMPLGPVPFGFMTLNTDFKDIVTQKVPSGLSYNSTEYSSTIKLKRSVFLEDPVNGRISEILNAVRKISTSELIEISHEDPSWIFHSNGSLYEISDKDLKNPIPNKKTAGRLDSDEQLIQASLVKGMIDDIVSESTDLEYPSDEQ